MDYVAHGQELMQEWSKYKAARVKDHVLDIQADKDELEKWARHLQFLILWESDLTRIAETCYQFQNRLDRFKDKIVIEILTSGAA